MRSAKTSLRCDCSSSLHYVNIIYDRVQVGLEIEYEPVGKRYLCNNCGNIYEF